LYDNRTIIGTFLAFDKHLNLVLSDAEEFRVIKNSRSGSSGLIEEKTEKRTLGLILIRGENVINLAVEGPPPPSGGKATTTTTAAAPGGPGIARGAGRGMMMQPPPGGGPGPAMGLGAAPIHGIGGGLPPPPIPGAMLPPPGMGRGMPPPPY
jgi:small nuclear ribonucleoprotein B and B'